MEIISFYPVSTDFSIGLILFSLVLAIIFTFIKSRQTFRIFSYAYSLSAVPQVLHGDSYKRRYFAPHIT